MNLRISRIIKDSIIDGPGKRFVIFTQGCYHNCPGCNSSQTHDPTGGKNIDTDEILKQIIKLVERHLQKFRIHCLMLLWLSNTHLEQKQKNLIMKHY